MKPLIPPDWDAIIDFDAIAEDKRDAREVLRGIQSSIAASYGHYKDEAPEFAGIEPIGLDAGQRRAMLDCYAPNRRTKACKEMLVRLQMKNPNLVACPLCGIDSASTWDHYLPKSAFPEFSVYAHNLMRSCAVCNTGRGEKWLGEDGRLIFHLYRDRIGEGPRLLVAQVDIVEGRPRVRYELECMESDPDFAGHFARHCNTLGLLPRFGSKGGARLAEIPGDLRAGRARLGAARAREVLRDMAECRAARYGLHHWEVALFHGAADSDTFIHYALGGTNS